MAFLGVLHYRTIFVALVLLFILRFFRRLSAPLSRLPGPFVTKLSSIPIFAYDYRSQRTEWIKGLHKAYGPIVRVSPYEVSVTSQTGIRDVFAGSPGAGGPFPKSKVFELFKHFGARNSFTSITAAQHGWRRKIIGSSYTQTAVLSRESATGNVWRVVGNYLDYVMRNGLPKNEEVKGKAIDIHMTNTFFAGDGVSSYVLLHGTQALAGDTKHRRLIRATQEKPGDMLSYLHQENREYFNMLSTAKATVKRLLPGSQVQVLSERTRLGDKDPEKLNSPWYGGTEMRDFGYRSYLDTKKAVQAKGGALLQGPIAAKLASNVMAGEAMAQREQVLTEDPSMRGFQDEVNFLKDAGAASEVMDHLIAGQDTTSETLSHALEALSLPENFSKQDKLRHEIQSLGELSPHNAPLSADMLNKILTAPYLDAIVKETLRRYPPHTVNIHRIVPAGGRLVDGYFLPAGTKIGTSAFIVQMNEDVFGSRVKEWDPERWLLKDGTHIRKMDQTMWAFGSGARGCVGKHLAMLEMKLLLTGIYSKFSTMVDSHPDASLAHDHFGTRTTNRDYSYFPNASGIITFTLAE